MRGKRGTQEQRQARRLTSKMIGQPMDTLDPCFFTCFMAFMMVRSSTYVCLDFLMLTRTSGLANMRLLVHGRTHKQRPQTRQFRGLL